MRTTASTQRRVAALVAVPAAAAAVLAGSAGVASASTTPPAASSSLLGTWTNVNASTNSVRNIVVTANGSGINVDAFGACEPTSCEMGSVPATVYGANVTATTGTNFLAKVDSGFARETFTGVLGTRIIAAAQPKLSITPIPIRLQTILTVNETTTFVDGTGRHNYSVAETFVKNGSVAVTRLGTVSVGYPQGQPPVSNPAIFKTWTETTGSNATISLKITKGANGEVFVHQWGACSPTACDNGTVRAVVFGPTVSSSTGNVYYASYNFGFKKQLLEITLNSSSNTLSVKDLNEFTDGRSNYLVNESYS